MAHEGAIIGLSGYPGVKGLVHIACLHSGIFLTHLEPCHESQGEP